MLRLLLFFPYTKLFIFRTMHFEENVTQFDHVTEDFMSVGNYTPDWTVSKNVTLDLERSSFWQHEFDDVIDNRLVRYTIALIHLTIIAFSIVGNFGLIVYILVNMARRAASVGRRGTAHVRSLTSSSASTLHRANVTTYLILNLAACDLVSSSTHHPLLLIDMLTSTKRHNGDDETTQRLCLVAGFFGCFLSGVAYHTLVAISQVMNDKGMSDLMLYFWTVHMCDLMNE